MHDRKYVDKAYELVSRGVHSVDVDIDTSTESVIRANRPALGRSSIDAPSSRMSVYLLDATRTFISALCRE